MVRFYHQEYQSLSRNIKLFLWGHAFHGFGYSIYSLLFNLFLREKGVEESVIGQLASMTSLGTVMIAFPAAFFIERFYVKPLLNVGLFVMACCYLMQIQCDSLTLFSLFGLLGSMGLALFNISVSPFIFRNSDPSKRIMLYTINSTVVMASHFFGFIIGGKLPSLIENYLQVAKVDSFKYAMTVGLSFILLSILIFSKLIKRKIPYVKKSIFQDIKQKNWNMIAKLVAPKVALALGAGMIIPFMNIYLRERLNLKTEEIGESYAILQLFILIGIILTPKFVKRMSSLSFMISTFLLAIPFMITMAFSSNLAIVLSSFFMRGMLMNMSSPITSLFEMERMREQECLFASAILVFSYNLAWTISTQLGGLMIEKFSFQSTFILAAVFYGISIICYFKFFHHEKKTVVSSLVTNIENDSKKVA